MTETRRLVERGRRMIGRSGSPRRRYIIQTAVSLAGVAVAWGLRPFAAGQSIAAQLALAGVFCGFLSLALVALWGALPDARG